MDYNRRIAKLSGIIDGQIEFYNYSMARYTNDPSLNIRQTNDYNYNVFAAQAFDSRQDSDLLAPAYTNVVKSTIDTITSKLANQKVRPYFNSVKSTYEIKQIIREAQRYFDIYLDNEKINQKVSQAFKNACIFGIGWLYIDILDDYHIKVLPPWTVGVQNTEKGYGDFTDVLIKFNNYPSTLLRKDYGKEFVQKCIYISTTENKCRVIIDGQVVESHNYMADTLPIIPIWYNSPIFGSRSTSLVQDLDGIQTQIDMINGKIAAASQLTPAQTTYVVEGTNIEASQLNNRTGNIYPVKMPPGLSQLPVIVDHPTPFDPIWQQMLDYYIQKAYEVVGISELSAMSKKPTGLDSGVALQSMEDIESDRFETQLDNYIQMYVNVVKTFIDIVPDSKDVINEESYNWKKLKEAAKEFKVQYSAATALSKDPSEKLKQVMQLSQIGLIGVDKVAEFLDTPDLEEAYSEARAMFAAANKVVDNALNGSFDIPEFVSYDLISKRLSVVQNELYSSTTDNEKGNNKIAVQLSYLSILESKLQALIEENGMAETSQPTETATSESGIGASKEMNIAPDIAQTVTANSGEPQGPNTTPVNQQEAANAIA